MEKDAYKEYLDALAELRDAVYSLKMQTLDTRDAMARTINGSHLRSILTLQKDDFMFRKLLELN